MIIKPDSVYNNTKAHGARFVDASINAPSEKIFKLQFYQRGTYNYLSYWGLLAGTEITFDTKSISQQYVSYRIRWTNTPFLDNSLLEPIFPQEPVNSWFDVPISLSGATMPQSSNFPTHTKGFATYLNWENDIEINYPTGVDFSSWPQTFTGRVKDNPSGLATLYAAHDIGDGLYYTRSGNIEVDVASSITYYASFNINISNDGPMLFGGYASYERATGIWNLGVVRTSLSDNPYRIGTIEF